MIAPLHLPGILHIFQDVEILGIEQSEKVSCISNMLCLISLPLIKQKSPAGFIVVSSLIKQSEPQHCTIILSPSDCKLSTCKKTAVVNN